MKIVNIAVRNITRNRRRSILSITSIAVAAMSMVFLFSYLEGMKKDISDNLHTYYSGEIQVRNRDYGKYEYLNPLHLRIESYEEVLREISRNDAVDVMSPRITFPAMIYTNEDTYKAVGLGVDIHLEKVYQDLENRIIEGQLPEKGKNETIMGIGLAGDVGVKTGDKITVMSTTMRRGSNAVTLRVTGLVNFPVQTLNKSYLLVPLDRAQKLLRMDSSVTEIIMKLKKREPAGRTADQLNRAFSSNGRLELEARSWEDIGSSYSFVELASSAYNFIALFFFILSSSVIINTTMMVIYERRREIGTVSAMGMTGGEIVGLFFIEALFLSLAGTLIGVLMGVGVTIPISITGINLGAAMEGVDLEMSNRIYPVLKLKSASLVFVYSVFIAALATILPSIKASRVKPVEALRNI